MYLLLLKVHVNKDSKLPKSSDFHNEKLSYEGYFQTGTDYGYFRMLFKNVKLLSFKNQFISGFKIYFLLL